MATCATIVNVPGPKGDAGADGTNGIDGKNPYTTVTVGNTWPAHSGTINLTVGDTSWMTVGQVVYLQNLGYMKVSSVTSTTVVVLLNLEDGTGAYASNPTPGTSINIGILVVPAGVQGQTGTLSGAAGGDLTGNYPNPYLGVTSVKGDLLVNNGAAPGSGIHGALGVGGYADGMRLMISSADALGLKYAKVDLASTAEVKNTLPLGNGGTGQITRVAAFDGLAPASPARGDIIYYNGTNWVKLAAGTSGNYLKTQGSGADPVWSAFTKDYVLVMDSKTQNTGGGGCGSGSWETRDLGSVGMIDTGSHASVASNQITLAAGTWSFRASAPGYKVNGHTLKLYQTSPTPGDIATGTGASAASGVEVMNRSWVVGRFTASATIVLELRHMFETPNATDGKGHPLNMAREIYAMIELWKDA